MAVGKATWAYVRNVSPATDNQLDLVFEDGKRGVYDMAPLLEWDVYSALRNPEVFRLVREEGGTAVWPGDIDIAPEELYLNCKPVE